VYSPAPIVERHLYRATESGHKIEAALIEEHASTTVVHPVMLQESILLVIHITVRRG